MATEKITTEAYVTLATNDNYAIGALALAQSLKSVNTNRSLNIMLTKEVSESLRVLIASVFDTVEVIDVLDSNDSANLSLLKRPELGVTFTKLHCWRLTQYTKCVFMDADCLVIANIDELFDREEFSAVTDVGWPDCFNSGVFVYRPSLETYKSLLEFAVSQGSFDGGDQGLLNLYFSNWSTSDASNRLPFIYNMTTNASYSYAPAFKQFGNKVKVIHFIGAQKPWYFTYNTSLGKVTSATTGQDTGLINSWWKVFSERVFPNLPEEFKSRMNTQYIQAPKTSTEVPTVHKSGSEITFSQVFQDTNNNAPQEPLVIGSSEHKNLWEQGQIDYTGRDSFSNIQAHLDAQLNK